MATSASFERLNTLRKEMQRSQVDGFLAPCTDAHQGEYVPAYAERVAWLTGFNGSAGFAIVMKERAALFVDGRYTLQAQSQVDKELFDIMGLAEIRPLEWLQAQLKEGQRIAYDPWLHTGLEVENYKKVCAKKKARLVRCETNLIDQARRDQPEPPHALAVPHDLKYSGQTTRDKISLLFKNLGQPPVDVVVLTMLDSIAWLLNMRGNDLPCTPVALAFAMLNKDETIDIFIENDKLGQEARSFLGERVRIHPPQEFEKNLRLSANKKHKIFVDPKTAAFQVIHIIREGGGLVIYGDDPCRLPKACKNNVEIKGMKAAHIRDGTALCNLLAWLTHTVPLQKVTEIDAVNMLFQMRSQQDLFKGVSFETISASGPNGAIIHYRACKESNCIIDPAKLYLLDSGGQYLDGTTDVTRTIAFQTPGAEQKDRFTRVLKGHIAIAQACFPKGTCGEQLDVLARQALWQIGVDYEHGTGHGVGSYLNVHEGPQSIGKRGLNIPLQPGMILSNEPGYYKKGAYGIRIESLMVAVEKNDLTSAEYPMLGFETLTMAPICLDLIDVQLLDASEIMWLNLYHTHVRETLMPFVNRETRGWLLAQTRKIN